MPPLEELPAAYLAVKRERDEMEGEIARLRWQLDKLTRQIFGPGKSEKLDRMQLLLQLKELEAATARAQAPKQTISYERTAPSAEKRPAPAELFAKLPVKETVVIEPNEVKADPEGFERIGEERTFDEARERGDGLAAGVAP